MTTPTDAGRGARLGRIGAGFRAWPRWSRVLTWAVLALVVVLIAVLVAGAVVVRRSFPQTTGTLTLPGLTAPVHVLRDADGVPQIYADTTDDLMRAQGYVAAQERFFSMDVVRHAVAGRSAELFGVDSVPADVEARTLGLRRTAERQVAGLDSDTRDAVQSFTDGVNAYLDQHSAGRISLEYTLLNAAGLGYDPEPWSVADSLSWLDGWAWDLSGRPGLAAEVDRVESAAAVGSARARRLFPDATAASGSAGSDRTVPVVDQGSVVDGAYEPNAPDSTLGGARRSTSFGRVASPSVVAPPTPDASPGLLGLTFVGGPSGSPGTVVAVDGTRTASGGPLLAAAPQLGVTLPSGLLPMGLHCTQVGPACPYDVSGLALPGVPGLLMGNGSGFAWALAGFGADVADSYVERVVGDDYRFDGALRPLRRRQETIEVAGGDEVPITVRASRHGPLVSDADPRLRSVAESAPVPHPARTAGVDSYALSLQWTGFDAPSSLGAILALDRSGDLASARRAAADVVSPPLGVVAAGGTSADEADPGGTIGYQAAGRVPIRRSGNDEQVPSPGWDRDADWSDQQVPFVALPNVIDPHDHLIVAADQATVGPGYPYHLTDDADHGFRATRLRTLLADRTGLTSADLGSALTDIQSPLTARLVPRLLDVDLPQGYDTTGQRLLARWSGGLSAGGAAAAYANAVWSEVLALTFHDQLPPDQWPDGGQRWLAVVQRLLAQPRSWWWDDAATDGVRETRDDVLAAALVDARNDLTRLIGPDPRDWAWGTLHRLQLRSPAPQLPGPDAITDRGGYGVGGGPTSVLDTSWDAADGFGVTSAPTARMVVDLGDPSACSAVVLGGVSGHAFAGHYDDQTDDWLAGRLLPLPVTADAGRAAAVHTLTLQP